VVSKSLKIYSQTYYFLIILLFIDMEDYAEEHQKCTPEMLGESVAKTIESLNEGDMVILPARHIAVKYLYLPQNVIIKGLPETVLEVTGAIFLLELFLSTRIRKLIIT
jgi:hypothetical protein